LTFYTLTRVILQTTLAPSHLHHRATHTGHLTIHLSRKPRHEPRSRPRSSDCPVSRGWRMCGITGPEGATPTRESVLWILYTPRATLTVVRSGVKPTPDRLGAPLFKYAAARLRVLCRRMMLTIAQPLPPSAVCVVVASVSCGCCWVLGSAASEWHKRK